MAPPVAHDDVASFQALPDGPLLGDELSNDTVKAKGWWPLVAPELALPPPTPARGAIGAMQDAGSATGLCCGVGTQQPRRLTTTLARWQALRANDTSTGATGGFDRASGANIGAPKTNDGAMFFLVRQCHSSFIFPPDTQVRRRRNTVTEVAAVTGN